MTQTIDQTLVRSSEDVAIELCEQRIRELEMKYPDWYELFEDVLPDTAPRAEVVELMTSAPTDFALGLMYGKFTMRMELEAVTGRPFA